MGKQRVESEKKHRELFQWCWGYSGISDSDGFVGVHSVTMLQNLHLYYCVFIKFYAINNEKAAQK